MTLTRAVSTIMREKSKLQWIKMWMKNAEMDSEYRLLLPGLPPNSSYYLWKDSVRTLTLHSTIKC